MGIPPANKSQIIHGDGSLHPFLGKSCHLNLLAVDVPGGNRKGQQVRPILRDGKQADQQDGDNQGHPVRAGWAAGLPMDQEREGGCQNPQSHHRPDINFVAVIPSEAAEEQVEAGHHTDCDRQFLLFARGIGSPGPEKDPERGGAQNHTPAVRKVMNQIGDNPLKTPVGRCGFHQDGGGERLQSQMNQKQHIAGQYTAQNHSGQYGRPPLFPPQEHAD